MIELMIGLALIAVLTTLAMPAYTNWIQNAKIRNAAESIQNGLQLARSEAVSRNTNVRFTLATGSTWSITVNETGEVLQARPSDHGSVGVTVVRTPATSTVTFNALGRVVPNADGSASLTQVDLDVTGGVLPTGAARPLSVAISSAGRIRMCDPAVSVSTDPRACV